MVYGLNQVTNDKSHERLHIETSFDLHRTIFAMLMQHDKTSSRLQEAMLKNYTTKILQILGDFKHVSSSPVSVGHLRYSKNK